MQSNITRFAAYIFSAHFFTVLVAARPLAQPTNDTTPSLTLNWHNCSSSDPSNLSCSQLNVPLDWDQPHGAQISIGVARLQAADQENRIGSLFFNPGGPGEAATDFIAYAAAGVPFFTERVLKHFDLIGMDPRGVGTSTPIKCNASLWNQRVSYFPTNEAAFRKMVMHNKAVGESCLELTGPLLRHVDTRSAARDMEALRVALGNEKLNYLGLSYGTQLGAAYAQLYPHQIRVMALDGNVDHSQSETSNLVTEATAYETELNRFANWCAQTESCALHGTDIIKLFDDLVAEADATPIPAPLCAETKQCRPDMTGEELRFNVQGLLATQNPEPGMASWADLATYLAEARAGNASDLSTTIARSDSDNNVFSGLAVECLDWTHKSTTLADIVYKEELAQVVAPHTQGASQTWTVQTACIGWPAPVVNPPHNASVEATVPILLVNAKFDPETSYVWANGLLNQISTGVLITRNGDGHTSYGLNGTTAAAMDSYLVNGTVPAPVSVPAAVDWSTVEIATAIGCACLPTYGLIFLRRGAVRAPVTGNGSRSLWGSRGAGNSSAEDKGPKYSSSKVPTTYRHGAEEYNPSGDRVHLTRIHRGAEQGREYPMDSIYVQYTVEVV
ncbi:hypothetical protein MMC13_007710 [Lambiella insularis]|nr:hypothetical protein [Lambiella insularis]